MFAKRYDKVITEGRDRGREMKCPKRYPILSLSMKLTFVVETKKCVNRNSLKEDGREGAGRVENVPVILITLCFDEVVTIIFSYCHDHK